MYFHGLIKQSDFDKYYSKSKLISPYILFYYIFLINQKIYAILYVNDKKTKKNPVTKLYLIFSQKNHFYFL